MNPPMNWVPVILVCPVLFCFGCVICFVWCLVLFCVSLLFAWFLMMTAQWTMYRSSPVLFCGLNSRWPGTLICITAHAMSYSVVNDLAKAMKALEGKNVKKGYESIWIYPVCCDYVWTGMHAAFDSGICIQTAG